MDDERLKQLQELLEEAKENNDDDKVIEIETEIFQMSSKDEKPKSKRMKAAKGGEAKFPDLKRRRVKMDDGGEVKQVGQQRFRQLGARARAAEDALLSGEKLSDEQIARYLDDLNEANMTGAISSKYDPYDRITLGVVRKVNDAKQGVKMKNGGEVKATMVATSQRGSSNKVSRGGGAAIRGTSFKGVF